MHTASIGWINHDHRAWVAPFVVAYHQHPTPVCYKVSAHRGHSLETTSSRISGVAVAVVLVVVLMLSWLRQFRFAPFVVAYHLHPTPVSYKESAHRGHSLETTSLAFWRYMCNLLAVHLQILPRHLQHR